MALDTELGLRLNHKRTELGYSVRELARRADLSASFISQVEHGKANVSVETLRKISECLGVSILYFLPGEKPQTPLPLNPPSSDQISAAEAAIYSPIVRAGCRARLTLPASGVSYELLNRDLGRKMEAVFGRLSPGMGNIARRLRQPTEEFIFVLEGSLLVGLESGDHVLNPGDSIYFEGEDLAKLACASEAQEVCWISVITPPVF